MAKKYVLLKDDSLESQKAIEELNKAKLDYDIAAFSTDEDLQLPVLLMPEGRCEGLTCIISFANSLNHKLY